jgi:hypothetical protein
LVRIKCLWLWNRLATVSIINAIKEAYPCKKRPLRDGPLLAQQYIKGDFLTLFAKKIAN